MQPTGRPLNLLLVWYQLVNWEGRHGHRDVLPRGWYALIQGNPLHCNPLNGKLVSQWSAVVCRFVPPLHSVPIFLDKGGFQGQEHFCVFPGRLHSVPMVCFQYHRDLVSWALDESLVARWILAHGDYHSHETPRVLQYPRVLPLLLSLGIENFLVEFRK